MYSGRDVPTFRLNEQLSKYVRGTFHDVESTNTGTKYAWRYNPVLYKSTILYTKNSMQDNVSSPDRIIAVTCVYKLLYAVLTNALYFHYSQTSIQNKYSLTL
jgi:hypothetical protein